VLRDLGAPLERVRERIQAALRLAGPEGKPPFSAEINRVLETASTLSAQEGAAAVTLDHVRPALRDSTG
jgi:hypothetical protein